MLTFVLLHSCTRLPNVGQQLVRLPFRTNKRRRRRRWRWWERAVAPPSRAPTKQRAVCGRVAPGDGPQAPARREQWRERLWGERRAGAARALRHEWERGRGPEELAVSARSMCCCGRGWPSCRPWSLLSAYDRLVRPGVRRGRGCGRECGPGRGWVAAWLCAAWRVGGGRGDGVG